MAPESLVFDEGHNAAPLLDSAPCLSGHELSQIGEIFMSHKQHRDWGICRMHRHHYLLPHEIMVHELAPGATIDVCKPYSKASTHLPVHPHSWRFRSDGRLTPFEYGDRIRPTFPPEFILELQNHLNAIGHQSDISLIPVDMSSESTNLQWVELVHDAERSMRSSLMPKTTSASHFEVVAWRFLYNENGDIEIVELKECRRNEITGIHKAVYS